MSDTTSDTTHGWKRPDIIVPVASRLPPPQRRKKPGATDEHQRSVGAIATLSGLTLILADEAIRHSEGELSRGISPADRTLITARLELIRELKEATLAMLGLATKPRRW